MVLACSDDHPEGARIWGTANPGEAVFVKVDSIPPTTAQATANATGFWALALHVKASLTSYNVSFMGSNHTVVLTNVLFGDTLLCSGQSK